MSELLLGCSLSALVPGSHKKVREIEAHKKRNWVGEGQERKWVGEGSRFIEPFTAVRAMMLSRPTYICGRVGVSLTGVVVRMA